MKISLSQDQWDGLVEQPYRWFPPCCRVLDKARGELRKARDNGGIFTPDGVESFLCSAIPHHAISEAWHGQPDQDPECHWLHIEGSPWPSIFSALRDHLTHSAS